MNQQPQEDEDILTFMARAVPALVYEGRTEEQATARAAGIYRAFSMRGDALYLQEQVTAQARTYLPEGLAQDEGKRAAGNFLALRAAEEGEGLKMALEALRARKDKLHAC